MVHGRARSKRSRCHRAILDALVQGCLPGDLARELRDVDAQPIGRVQAGVDVPDVGDRIEPAGLHRDGLQHARREVGRQRIAQLVGNHALDRLQPFGRRCRRDDVLEKQIAWCGRGAFRCRLSGRILAQGGLGRRRAGGWRTGRRCRLGDGRCYARGGGVPAVGEGNAGGAAGGVGSLTSARWRLSDSVRSSANTS